MGIGIAESETGNQIRNKYIDKSIVRMQAEVSVGSAVQWQREQAEAKVRKQAEINPGRAQGMVRTSWVGNWFQMQVTSH